MKSKWRWRWSVLGFGTLLLFFLFDLRVAEARPNSAIRAFNDAVKAFNQKNFNEAVPLLDDAISADPDFAEAYYARGACKYYLKSLDGALMDLNDALRLKSDYLEARSLRGSVNYEADHWDAAIEDFNYVLQRSPSDAQALLGRAVIRLKRQEVEGAEKDFRNFLRVKPNDPLAPKIREVLASLGKRGRGEPTSEEGAESPESSPSRRTSRAVGRSSDGDAYTEAELQKLADSLMSRSISQSYDRKVLRGEKAQAIGNIENTGGTSAR